MSWPHAGKIETKSLVEAGFFFDPRPSADDRCQCFACGLTLYAWDIEDNPYIEHSKNTDSNCAYLECVKRYRPELLRPGEDIKADLSENQESLEH